MKPNPVIIYAWPEMPALPPPGQPVLVRVRTSASRPSARQELRTVLRETLAAWSNIPRDQLPLQETSRGPVWPGTLAGHTLDISLSYSENEGWIGMLREGRIGLDAVPLGTIAEAEDVARHYLGPVGLARIQQSPDPTHAFALAWTELEARVKCLKVGLSEWAISQADAFAKCTTQHFVVPDRVVVAVTTAAAL